MTKEEFLQAAGIEHIGETDYNVIEFVYTYHPSISNGDGKKQIAAIYNLPGGMRIIKDMLSTAQNAEAIHAKIDYFRSQMKEWEHKLINLGNPA